MNELTNKLEELWSREEQGYWLALDQLQVPGVGSKRIKSLVEMFQGAKGAWHADTGELKASKILGDTVFEFVKKRQACDPEAVLKSVESKGIVAYPLLHPLYPTWLSNIFDPPLILYTKGRLGPMDWLYCLALVGTRRPTSYGQKMSKEFATLLAEQGVVIVSGMALGCDSYAHWGALEAGGKTIAVLANGVDLCYPTSNKPLYKRLTEDENAVVVSEYFPGTEPDTWRFPARNRLIAGLSQGCLVIEAGEESGALITAGFSHDENRPVFALPGRIDNPVSKGCHKLILNDVAHLTTSIDAILKQTGWATAKLTEGRPLVVQLYGKEREIFEALSVEPLHFDVLVDKLGLTAGELSACLTMLELANLVERHAGDRYSRMGP